MRLIGGKILLLLVISCLFISNVGAVTLVPLGNRHSQQPDIPGASSKRTRELATSFEAKYQKIYDLLKNDAKLRERISATAKLYDIDPIHMAGAIIGEHTYNVDVYDRLQTYYIKSISYLKQGVNFSYNGEAVSKFVTRPQFKECEKYQDSYRLWSCRENVFDKIFRGQKVDGVSYPDSRFSAVFFQPFYAGQTFGLGQMSPLIALMMSDRVNKVSSLPKLSADNGGQVYQTIMDPNLTLHYIAATIRQSIDDYRQIAGFDISQNPGITATLYNTGGSIMRAKALAEKNMQARNQGLAPHFPEENYYGWFVNSKLAEIKKLF